MRALQGFIAEAVNQNHTLTQGQISFHCPFGGDLYQWTKATLETWGKKQNNIL